MQNNQRASPLLRLPPEIRNKIFEYACTGANIEMTGPVKGPVRYTCGEERMKYPPKHLELGEIPIQTDAAPETCAVQLPAVSRQIYHETSELLYKGNTFSIDYSIIASRKYSLDEGISAPQTHPIHSLPLARRKAITTIRLSDELVMGLNSRLWQKILLRRLPGVRTVKMDAVQLEVQNRWTGVFGHSIQGICDALSEYLQPLADKGIKVVFEQAYGIAIPVVDERESEVGPQ